MNTTTTRQQQNNKFQIQISNSICCFVVVLLLSYSLSYLKWWFVLLLLLLSYSLLYSIWCFVVICQIHCWKQCRIHKNDNKTTTTMDTLLSCDQAGWFSILNIERYIQSKNKMILFANEQQNTSLLTWQYKIQFFRTSSRIVNLMGEFPFLLCLLYSNILSSRDVEIHKHSAYNTQKFM